MTDLQRRMAELAQLMDEFGLVEAKWKTPEGSIAFSRRDPAVVRRLAVGDAVAEAADAGAPVLPAAPVAPAAPAAPAGTPVSSPMTGIYYASPSPGNPPFAKEGDVVAAGQVVGLIEAMKVFNEITAPTAGTVLKVVAESGQLVQPGEPLLYIG